MSWFASMLNKMYTVGIHQKNPYAYFVFPMDGLLLVPSAYLKQYLKNIGLNIMKMSLVYLSNALLLI
jgi:hypothetical protein